MSMLVKHTIRIQLTFYMRHLMCMKVLEYSKASYCIKVGALLLLWTFEFFVLSVADITVCLLISSCQLCKVTSGLLAAIKPSSAAGYGPRISNLLEIV